MRVLGVQLMPMLSPVRVPSEFMDWPSTGRSKIVPPVHPVLLRVYHRSSRALISVMAFTPFASRKDLSTVL